MGTVTISGNDYDVFGDLPEALVYLAGSMSTSATAFIGAQPDMQKRGLVTATRLIERQAFRDDVDPDGEQDIIDASYERAAYIVQKQKLADQGTTAVPIESVTAGPVSVTFAEAALTKGTRFPPVVQELIEPYLAGDVDPGLVSGGGESTGGDCEPSWFNDSNPHRRY